ncbi:uncharacterized protein CLUP02_02482 [Colletotrichum lupini]|uniref:Uncharacterized protein n=1 Tax=Colletotrichum lupini TaxID=145971 RepID=A0A9Q8WBE7_9PEZI|nr:uncharacterized protein CLUP02_02482 [Colletotrichum lupini]UQC77016.1 hypothetical protein CLUP02_02482 [Colletotrichum lupini]
MPGDSVILEYLSIFIAPQGRGVLRAAHPLPGLDLRCNWAKRGGSQAGQEEPPSHPPPWSPPPPPPIWHPTPQTSGNEMAYEVWTVERAPFLSLVHISFSWSGDVTSPLKKREETGERVGIGRSLDPSKRTRNMIWKLVTGTDGFVFGVAPSDAVVRQAWDVCELIRSLVRSSCARFHTEAKTSGNPDRVTSVWTQTISPMQTHQRSESRYATNHEVAVPGARRKTGKQSSTAQVTDRIRKTARKKILEGGELRVENARPLFILVYACSSHSFREKSDLFTLALCWKGEWQCNCGGHRPDLTLLVIIQEFKMQGRVCVPSAYFNLVRVFLATLYFGARRDETFDVSAGLVLVMQLHSFALFMPDSGTMNIIPPFRLLHVLCQDISPNLCIWHVVNRLRFGGHIGGKYPPSVGSQPQRTNGFMSQQFNMYVRISRYPTGDGGAFSRSLLRSRYTECTTEAARWHERSPLAPRRRAQVLPRTAAGLDGMPKLLPARFRSRRVNAIVSAVSSPTERLRYTLFALHVHMLPRLSPASAIASRTFLGASIVTEGWPSWLWRQVKVSLTSVSWWGNPREFESRPFHFAFFGIDYYMWHVTSRFVLRLTGRYDGKIFDQVLRLSAGNSKTIMINLDLDTRSHHSQSPLRDLSSPFIPFSLFSFSARPG